uniref:Uncharacterized protein n=1 Tax=Palpitomonas bilix TaxID=652834 RepID=A0A7S3DJD2_9EUKA|mmetsp:Transcript_3962/g.7544  ORF Transcript_3962/g.7544 Transcript_3962/m.7544 type:complete len:133 (+) Transcript_3962:106-504(+)
MGDNRRRLTVIAYPNVPSPMLSIISYASTDRAPRFERGVAGATGGAGSSGAAAAISSQRRTRFLSSVCCRNFFFSFLALNYRWRGTPVFLYNSWQVGGSSMYILLLLFFFGGKIPLTFPLRSLYLSSLPFSI